jgi:hypothetical protein
MLLIVAHLHILHLFLLVMFSCMFIAYLYGSCLFVDFFVFFNTYSCCSCLLIAFSRCSYLFVASLCHLALVQQCLVYPLKLKLHACWCFRYLLKCKLPPHRCLMYLLKFKLLVHHILFVVVCLLFPYVWYFPFLAHVGCGMRRQSIINTRSFLFLLFFWFSCLYVHITV